MTTWDAAGPGVVALPSGRLLRARGLRRGSVEPRADLAVLLTTRRPPPTALADRWVRWPDFGLPLDRDDARSALFAAWRRCGSERVEIACGGGVGRTGTALACLVVLDGVAPADAVDYVRRHYHRRGVETPWQRRWVTSFAL